MIDDNPLLQSIRRPDSHFDFEILETKVIGSSRFYDVEFTSQEWKGTIWTHRLAITIPAKSLFPDLAFLMIGADYPFYIDHATLGHIYAEQLGVTCAFLYDVPNQPLFDGLIEDGIIAYTFDQYLDTGDADWILLGPMTKTALRAMDVVQKIHGIRNGSRIERFTVNGASKRGWTTWLAAVADSRVAGIAPQVYDNLNIGAQLPHQKEIFEGYSARISDYTERNLPEKMKTPRGRTLTQMIDPYAYRSRLTLPKLILNAANDPYWATDASQFYADELSGETRFCYAPNCGHGYNDTERLYGALAGFVTSVGSGDPMPGFKEWLHDCQVGNFYFQVTPTVPAIECNIWLASSESRDFRNSQWEIFTQGIESLSEGATIFFEPMNPYCNYAYFAELVFDRKPFPLRITTPISTL